MPPCWTFRANSDGNVPLELAMATAEWTEEEAIMQAVPGTLSVHISVLAIFRILAKTANLTANRNVLPAQGTNPIPDSSAPVGYACSSVVSVSS
ncbi:hypothetical protein VP1G_11312 [Cytospora mali]|uniref:Uncharacterized protein n=1 Tax=Cytospora mali TaxID=578113 RepID=A0A194VEJ4_CYTMA|nr:hypothetical protein VP1G_11312 [Valsa mali var. pyri (nom. inval.)]